MRDLVDMWGNTRMVVLTAMCASLYAAILIPFKVLPIIPGVTEFRPANAVPVVCSFLFGPAGAWGAAIGNVIGDFFGGIGPGDMFGFAGNLLYGLIPYKAWEALSDGDPVPRTAGGWMAFLTVVLLASAACALVIGWGINLLGFVPFRVLGNVILLNNCVTSIVLAPLLLSVIYPRVKRAQLRYCDILPHRRVKPRAVRRVGLCIVAVATIGGMVVGNLLSNGSLHLPFLPQADLAGGTGAAAVGFGLVPVIALLLVGVALL
jgi:energy-coupling factor transport system substrate-specific component